MGKQLVKYGDIAVRTGLHCAPLAHETIGTMPMGTVRFSFGYFNTKHEIDTAVAAIKKIAAMKTETT